jgi:allantoicase/malate synthase/CubicO group peptidase (beta-lactamase class C family)
MPQSVSSPRFQNFISKKILDEFQEEFSPLSFDSDFERLGSPSELETPSFYQFLSSILSQNLDDLDRVLAQRVIDREFVDERTKALSQFNLDHQLGVDDPDYQTVLNLKDEAGRVVVGPLQSEFHRAQNGAEVQVPEEFQGNHVTLFGPPDNPKMCINAMNSLHRIHPQEPELVDQLVESTCMVPMWGADCEDSKTPIESDLLAAAENLQSAFAGDLSFEDTSKTGEKRSYELASDGLSRPIKRFVGLAIPCSFLKWRGELVPLHIFEFCLHLFYQWQRSHALAFYVPKLENEEEARYLKHLIASAEEQVCGAQDSYQMGTVKLMVVLENPRAIFRINEIIDELDPYFMGASLGWHDFLASTARLFRHDSQYRIPVKSDPDIVIKYIHASHEILSDVVGGRGGVKVGGMYGILPLGGDWNSSSYQITLRGFFKDVLIQLKRGLDGFWVAHPDFVRIGIAITHAYKLAKSGDECSLKKLIKDCLIPQYAEEVEAFYQAQDIAGLSKDSPDYPRSLIVSNVGLSNIIPNHDPEEVRYNIFQSLQYLTDWLTGNGCVALPANIEGINVRVMDDLATAERSRWEVWHEVNHGRISAEKVIQIIHEEMRFIRKDLSHETKQVQVKWSDHNSRWYEVAKHLLIKLIVDPDPVEFISELLLPFTMPQFREIESPWEFALEIDPDKYAIASSLKRYDEYFELCGAHQFAREMSLDTFADVNRAKSIIMNFDDSQIISAASYHGDLGAPKKGLDRHALAEQAQVSEEDHSMQRLAKLAESYRSQFGFKFLMSAKGKNAAQILKVLERRIENSREQERENAKMALFEITKKRMHQTHKNNFWDKIFSDLGISNRTKLPCRGLQLSLTEGHQNFQSFWWGEGVQKSTTFQIASLSKSIGAVLALDVLKDYEIELSDSVNQVLRGLGSQFVLSDPVEGKAISDDSDCADHVTIRDLLQHTALNMHYVNGIEGKSAPEIDPLLLRPQDFGYQKIEVKNRPGQKFSYSGAGFMVLEHILELVTGKGIDQLLKNFCKKWGLDHLGQNPGADYCPGSDDSGKEMTPAYLHFPALAAGLFSNSLNITRFLAQLADAYALPEFNRADDSHSEINRERYEIARTCLNAYDYGSMAFMNCKMGLGFFVGEAGENRLMIHQGANDGYRAVYLFCFDGPDRGKGFTILASGEEKAVEVIGQLSQRLLKQMNFSGVDFDRFRRHLNVDGFEQQERVNQGLKALVFDAFRKRQREFYPRRELMERSSHNVLKDAKISFLSDDSFAPVENLISPYRPQFDPGYFGADGKVMDSWESARHNPNPYHYCRMSLPSPVIINYVEISTQYHLGNQVEAVEVIAWEGNQSRVMIPKTAMPGHAQRLIALEQGIQVEKVEVRAYPDGGLSRLAMYHKVPDPNMFTRLEENVPIEFQTAIAQVQKPMFLEHSHLKGAFKGGGLDNNLADSLAGAKVLRSSNEHYAPASQVISPFQPLNMFDGLETARSREKDHFDFVEIQLARRSPIARIDLDFQFFIHNNPRSVSILARQEGDDWCEIVGLKNVKAFRGGIKSFLVSNKQAFDQIQVKVFPDGGINRLYVWEK